MGCPVECWVHHIISQLVSSNEILLRGVANVRNNSEKLTRPASGTKVFFSTWLAVVTSRTG